MKTIMFVALLAAAGCSKKGSDCEVSIGQGIEGFAATIKAKAPNPQIQESKLGMLGKLRGTLTQRCTQDKWAPEVVSCFATVAAMKDLQACQQKLSTDQRTRLTEEIRGIMVTSMGARVSSDLAGAPAGSGGMGGEAAPAPAGSAAPDPAAGSNAK